MTITQPLQHHLQPSLHQGGYLKLMLHYGLALLLAAAATLSHAQDSVSIHNPWVKATYPGQNVSAGYMTLTSANEATLLKITSDISDSVEIHSMKMENGVMKMRMLPILQLPAGKPYKLEPSGFHLMLFDLKKPLVDAQTVNFELTFKNSQNVEFKQNVKAIVKSADSSTSDHEHHHNH
nr:copper chaperone PCu(A)C [uncultured Methylotenera sp.]